MNILLYFWHLTLLEWEEEELHERSIEGSCSDSWACNVMHRCRWRRIVLRRLRMQSAALRLVLKVGRLRARFYFRPLAS